MTRARDFLYVTWPVRYYHKWHKYTDRHSYAQMCRFFTEEVRAGMTAVRASPEETEESAPAGGKADIAARVKSMWD
jgi:cytosine/adenosine deaminase-related metal-dependent hydrolase